MIPDYTETHIETILTLGVQEASAVLDIGCGNGAITSFIAQSVDYVVGIDPNEHAIHTACSNYPEKNLTFQVGRAESLPFPDRAFDVVLFNESLHHVLISHQMTALKEAHRVLYPGGRLLITEPIHGSGAFSGMLNLYDDEKEQKQYALRAIENALISDFDLAEHTEIQITYLCSGIDDLYTHYRRSRPSAVWSADKIETLRDRLQCCPRDEDGDYLLDYWASVWLLVRWT